MNDQSVMDIEVVDTTAASAGVPPAAEPIDIGTTSKHSVICRQPTGGPPIRCESCTAASRAYSRDYQRRQRNPPPRAAGTACNDHDVTAASATTHEDEAVAR